MNNKTATLLTLSGEVSISACGLSYKLSYKSSKTITFLSYFTLMSDGQNSPPVH